jgi:hypothetical protein
VVNLLYGADSVFVKYTLQENKTELWSVSCLGVNLGLSH